MQRELSTIFAVVQFVIGLTLLALIWTRPEAISGGRLRFVVAALAAVVLAISVAYMVMRL
jgi:hypothetical protein